MKEVWKTVLICIDFAILLPCFLRFLCFIRYPNTLKWVKKNSVAPHFQPTSRSLDILINNSFSCLIYYILNAIDHGVTSIMIVQSTDIPGYHRNGTLGCQSHHCKKKKEFSVRHFFKS